MKTRKKLLFTLFIVLLALAGCEFGDTDMDPDHRLSGEAISSDDPSDPEGTSPIINDPLLPPRDGMVRSILTNEWIDEEIAEARPIAVIIPNESRAQPHYNLSKASIVYEAKVEGSMTRLMAIYENWQHLEKIGNVRSIRRYFAYWAFEWDPIIVHYGGPYFAYEVLDTDTTENVDGTQDTSAFFRTTDREAPHNAYTSGPGIISSIKQHGYSMNYRGLTMDHHFTFASGQPNDLSQYGESAETATYVDMTGAYPLTRCYFNYDPESELYYRFQYLSGSNDGPHVDGATGEQLSFSNLIVQRVKQETMENGYLVMQCHDTTKDGWFFTKGKGIHVTWQKTGDYEPTQYFDDDGNEIQLNTGKTMILIIKDTDQFTFR